MNQELHHNVFFRLVHEKGSVREKLFFDETQVLFQIPDIDSHRIVREVGSRNRFDYGLLMTFSGQEAYEAYRQHPFHLQYVSKIWVPQVEEFLEIDWIASEEE